MLVHPADRVIVKWAMDHSAPHYYTSEADLPSPCLKVQCGYVTAYFHEGELVRLWAHADGECLDDMFVQMTQLFGLCAEKSQPLMPRRLSA
jgi:hypothetical protein